MIISSRFYAAVLAVPLSMAALPAVAGCPPVDAAKLEVSTTSIPQNGAIDTRTPAARVFHAKIKEVTPSTGMACPGDLTDWVLTVDQKALLDADKIIFGGNRILTFDFNGAHENKNVPVLKIRGEDGIGGAPDPEAGIFYLVSVPPFVAEMISNADGVALQY